MPLRRIHPHHVGMAQNSESAFPLANIRRNDHILEILCMQSEFIRFGTNKFQTFRHIFSERTLFFC